MSVRTGLGGEGVGSCFGRSDADLVKQEVKKEFRRFAFSVGFEAETS